MRLKLSSLLLSLVFGAASVQAAPQVRYRITPIAAPPDSYITATGLNNWGEVVGSWAGEIGQHGFHWRNGNLSDLNDLVYPNASYVEASGINDHHQIAGIYADPSFEGFRGFILDYDTGQVRDVAGPPGSVHVFANSINDRGVIRGAAYDAEGNYRDFLNDHGNITVFNGPFEPTGGNDFGVYAGREAGRATLWKDGVTTPIGPPFSSAWRITNRGQVIGQMDSNTNTRAFLWERGVLTPLPKLREDQTYSWAQGINLLGVIVGTTVINEPTGTVNIPTLWANGQVYDLNTLIHPNDPRRGFVTLSDVGTINELGVILARGTDSRLGTPDQFILTPVLVW